MRIREQQEYVKLLQESKEDIQNFTKQIEAHSKATLPPKERDWAFGEVGKISQYISTVEQEYNKAPKCRPPNPSVSDINRIMMTLKEKIDAVLENYPLKKAGGGIFGKVFDKFRSP